MIDLHLNKKNKSSNFQQLNDLFEEKRDLLISEIEEKHNEAIKWAKSKGINTRDLAQKGARGLAATAATSAVLFSGGIANLNGLVNTKDNIEKNISEEIDNKQIDINIHAREDVSFKVKKALLNHNFNDEENMEKLLSKTLNLKIKAQLEGIRLGSTYGIMGYESHLTRYPGDNLASHFHSNIEYQNFSRAHMAGGPGAFGYIAPNREKLTDQDIEKEKYYLVAQTWLSPNWGGSKVKNWFKHRKMVVVNPVNGRVVVGVIADAGPEESTGRQFGGSPEVYQELDLFRTGPKVLMYFVDDPENKIPLGRYGI